ncbi:VOC family protein [Actinomycetospora straminea]|uniref:VOC domain-containing protein n=1 Tax=Actinomycetospora straminea TaxID=663607 RepID=A0ABP9E5E8_9PSEU|nr:VOC family protein [Actinomycetospora straminea]MDD7932737.1 VOC family protein [Actinomycetospora straminea]
MSAQLFAYLSYDDAPAALRWLEAVGFAVVRRQDGEDGRVVHAEVRFGDVVLMVASTDADYATPPLRGRSTGRGLYLLVDDVDDCHARAVAAGASSVIDPEDTEWGTRRARVLDPAGQEWSFGTYRPGEAW